MPRHHHGLDTTLLQENMPETNDNTSWNNILSKLARLAWLEVQNTNASTLHIPVPTMGDFTF